MRKSSSLGQTQGNHPAVKWISIQPVSPWSVLVSWETPATFQGSPALKEYVLSGSVVKTVPATDQYMFLYKDTEIEPGEDVTVKVEAKYDDNQVSPPVEATATMPSPRKLLYSINIIRQMNSSYQTLVGRKTLEYKSF